AAATPTLLARLGWWAAAARASKKFACGSTSPHHGGEPTPGGRHADLQPSRRRHLLRGPRLRISAADLRARRLEIAARLLAPQPGQPERRAGVDEPNGRAVGQVHRGRDGPA